MWLRVRKTDSLGRWGSPRTPRRMRSWRRWRVSLRSAFFSIPNLLRLPAHGAASLAWLQPDALARVANALPLVGIRLPDGPDARGDLADEFLVDPGDADAVRLRHLERDALGGRDLHRVAVADLQGEGVPLLGRPIADALNLQIHLEPFCDAADHVGQQRSGQPVQSFVVVQIGRPPHDDRPVGQLHADIWMHLPGKAPLGPLHLDGAPGDLDLHALRDRDGRIPYARHNVSSSSATRRSTRPRRRRPSAGPAGRSRRPARW